MNPAAGVSVAFPDASNGWAVGYPVGGSGTIVHTSNGGTTWSSQASGTGSALTDVVFPTTMDGWAVGESRTIVHTSDGGATWTAQTDPDPITNHLYGVASPDAMDAWAVGTGCTIVHTSNGGATWSMQSSGTCSGLLDVAFTTASGAAVPEPGTLTLLSIGLAGVIDANRRARRRSPSGGLGAVETIGP